MYNVTLVITKNGECLREYQFDNPTELLQMVGYWEQIVEADKSYSITWF